jgi:hypothetical protein
VSNFGHYIEGMNSQEQAVMKRWIFSSRFTPKKNQLRCFCTAATCKSLRRFFFGCVLRFMEL